MSVVFHDDYKIASRQSMLTLLTAGSPGCHIDFLTSGNTVLASVPLDHPPGTVNSTPSQATTGRLTLAIAARDEDTAASGDIAKARLIDKDGKIVLESTCSAGSAPVANTFVVSSLTVVAGSPFEVISATIG